MKFKLMTVKTNFILVVIYINNAKKDQGQEKNKKK